jgi:hypothetical protein
VRAGFMLIPDSGASSVMNAATSTPAAMPVSRASRSAFDITRTVSIITNEIAVSAPKAHADPGGPGIVETKFTEAFAANRRKTSDATHIPAVPPRNCALM